MRSGEMLGLEWSRVDLSANLIYLSAEHQKNGQIGSVPINSVAREAIMSRLRFRAVQIRLGYSHMQMAQGLPQYARVSKVPMVVQDLKISTGMI
jgi:integrase